MLRTAVSIGGLGVALSGCAHSPKTEPKPVSEPSEPSKSAPVVHVRSAPDVRWCQIRPDGSATCHGKPPEVGDVGTVVDEVDQRATVRVTSIEPVLEECGSTNGWEIVTETVTGDVTRSNYAWSVLFDYPTSSSTHYVWNSGQIPVPGGRGPELETIWASFEDDTDGMNPDLIITYFYCDKSGTVAPKESTASWCIAYYTQAASSYAEQRVDVMPSC